MASLLMVILDDLAALPEILKRWREIGVPGITILHSIGGFHMTSWLERVGLSMLGRAFESGEVRQRTLLSLIDDDALVERAIAEAEQLVGGFDRPSSGVLFVVPVTRALGLKKRQPATAEEALTVTTQLLVDMEKQPLTTVAHVLEIHPREPAIVKEGDSLVQVAGIILDHPGAQLVCVVNEEGRLVGILDLDAIVDELLMEIMPEEVLGHMTELDQALRYAERLKHATAGDAMQEPVSIQPSELAREAIRKMYQHGLPGLPVVDETHHVIGYLSLLETLGLFARGKLAGSLEKGNINP